MITFPVTLLILVVALVALIMGVAIDLGGFVIASIIKSLQKWRVAVIVDY